MTRGTLAMLPALLLAGCAVGPNYKRPAVTVPSQFPGAAADAASLADKKWSDLFDDAALRQLLADSIAIMRQGRVVQEGTFEELAAHPTDAFVAEFIAAQRPPWIGPGAGA